MGVFVAVLVVTFIQLGEWQLRRLDERRASNATVQTHQALPVRPYGEVMTGEIGDDDQWHRVSATGTYTGDQFQVRYRSLDGAYGSEVVAVLKTDRGDNLLVNRGFLTRQPGHPDGVMPDTLPGTVTVTGYVRRNDRGDSDAMVPHEDQIRLLNSDAIATALGEPVVNGYLTLISSDPKETAGLLTIPPPDLLDEGPHQSYAFQWFAFTAIAVIGLGVLIRADLRDRKKAKAKAAAAGGEPPADDADAVAEAPGVGTGAAGVAAGEADIAVGESGEAADESGVAAGAADIGAGEAIEAAPEGVR